jgi:hypothetical protein
MRDQFSTVRYQIEEQDRWHKVIPEIPYIQFPAEWQIRVIPPFGGLIARFNVKLPSGLEKSIYLDYYDRAGCVGHPYWEVYPVQGDCGRCSRDDVAELLKLIADETPEPSNDD